MMINLPRLLNLKEVIAITGIARTTIYRRMDEGTFPKGLKLSEGCVRWKEPDIAEWIESLPKHG